MKARKNIKDFDGFLMESSAQQKFYVVSENGWPAWSKEAQEKELIMTGVYLDKNEADDEYYKIIDSNYEGDEVWDCISYWFDELSPEERKEHGIPQEMDADDFWEVAHDFDFYDRIWRECVDGADDTFDLADVEEMTTQEILERIRETFDALIDKEEKATFMSHIYDHVPMPDQLNVQIKRILRGASMFGI